VIQCQTFRRKIFVHLSRAEKALFPLVRINDRIVNQTKCSVSVMPQLLDSAGEKHIRFSCCGKVQLMSFPRFPCGKYKYLVPLSTRCMSL